MTSSMQLDKPSVNIVSSKNKGDDCSPKSCMMMYSVLSCLKKMFILLILIDSLASQLSEIFSVVPSSPFNRVFYSVILNYPLTAETN